MGRRTKSSSGFSVTIALGVALAILVACGGSTPRTSTTVAAPTTRAEGSRPPESTVAYTPTTEAAPTTSALPAPDPSLAADLARVTVAGPDGIFRFQRSGAVTTIATGPWAMAIALPDGLYAAQRQRPTFFPLALSAPELIPVQDQAIYRIEAGKEPTVVLPAPQDQKGCTAPPPLGSESPIPIPPSTNSRTFQRLDGAMALENGSRTAVMWLYVPSTGVGLGETKRHNAVTVDLLTGECQYARPPLTEGTNGDWLVPDNAAVHRVSFGLRFYLYVQDDGTTVVAAPVSNLEDPKAPTFTPSDFGLEDVYLTGQFAHGQPWLRAAAVDEGISGRTVSLVGFVIGNHLTVFDVATKKPIFGQDLPDLAGSEEYEIELTRTAVLVNVVNWTSSTTRLAMLTGFNGKTYRIPLAGYATFSHEVLAP